MRIKKSATIIIFILIFIITAAAFGNLIKRNSSLTLSSNISFNNYQKLFEKDAMIIRAKNAAQTEVDGAQTIADYIYSFGGNMPLIKTDADITENEKADYNLIILGVSRIDTAVCSASAISRGLCTTGNSLIQNIYNQNQDLQTKAVNSYWEGTNKGSLLLYPNPWVSFGNSPKYILVVDGFDENGLKSAIEVLINNDITKRIYGTGIITKWEKGENTWDVADTATKQIAGSLALGYFKSKYQTYPEAHFSFTNVTSQNGDWLVEIGSYSEIRRNNEIQTRLVGIAGRLLVSKINGEIKEVK